MILKAFCPRSRRFFAGAVLDVPSGLVRVATRRRIPSEELVLLPKTGHVDVHGAPVFLGDAFKRSVNGQVETYLVGPLPVKGELRAEFELRLVNVENVAGATTLKGRLSLSSDVVAQFDRAGNVYENYIDFVPANQHFCYRTLDWNEKSGFFDIHSLCPFWQDSDHGMVYCRFLQQGSLTATSATAFLKAVVHFGSQDAVNKANKAGLVWDQVKACGVNEDCADEDE